MCEHRHTGTDTHTDTHTHTGREREGGREREREDGIQAYTSTEEEWRAEIHSEKCLTTHSAHLCRLNLKGHLLLDTRPRSASAQFGRIV
jgi:hypothetical protein